MVDASIRKCGQPNLKAPLPFISHARIRMTKRANCPRTTNYSEGYERSKLKRQFREANINSIETALIMSRV